MRGSKSLDSEHRRQLLSRRRTVSLVGFTLGLDLSRKETLNFWSVIPELRDRGLESFRRECDGAKIERSRGKEK